MTPNNDKPTLIVEDDPSDAALLRLALKRLNVLNQLILLPNGDQVIAYLEGRGPYSNRELFPRPGAILLDLKLPGTSGLEVLAWMYAQAHMRDIPVFILSGFKDNANLTAAYKLGAKDFLTKPATREELFVLVHAHREIWMTDRGKTPNNGHFPTADAA